MLLRGCTNQDAAALFLPMRGIIHAIPPELKMSHMQSSMTEQFSTALGGPFSTPDLRVFVKSDGVENGVRRFIHYD